MSDQPKTPGAMVLVERDLLCRLQERLDCHRDARDWNLICNAIYKPAEQTPEVGGLDWSKSVYEHCRSCKGWLPLLDGGCRPCTELRAALARIAEPEAQQGEPVAVIDEGEEGLFAEFIYGEDGSPLRRGDKLYLNPADKGYVSKLAYQAMQAEVARLEAQLSKANDWSHLKPDMDPPKP